MRCHLSDGLCCMYDLLWLLLGSSFHRVMCCSCPHCGQKLPRSQILLLCSNFIILTLSSLCIYLRRNWSKWCKLISVNFPFYHSLNRGRTFASVWNLLKNSHKNRIFGLFSVLSFHRLWTMSKSVMNFESDFTRKSCDPLGNLRK